MASMRAISAWLSSGLFLQAIMIGQGGWRHHAPKHHYASAFTTLHTRSASRCSPMRTSMKTSNAMNRRQRSQRHATPPEAPLQKPVSSPHVPSTLVVRSDSKLRRLKDRMWVREALEDLTAAEFASSLSLEADETNRGNGTSRKRAVDFENVLAKLDARVEEMCVQMTEEESAKQDSTCYVLDRRVVGDEGKTTIENSCYVLAADVGMGNVVYTTEQREALLSRLMATREKLLNFMEGSASPSGDDLGDIEDIRSQLQPTNYSSVVDTKAEIKSGFDPSLYVREDGTIDWDGALQDREALKKFGSAVWSRINGQDPENSSEINGDDGMASFGDDFSHNKPVTAKIVETDAIREKKQFLDKLRLELNVMEVEQTKLLNSGSLFVV